MNYEQQTEELETALLNIPELFKIYIQEPDEKILRSIEEQGVQKPLYVYKDPFYNKYEVLDGVKRVLACKKLCRNEPVKAIVIMNPIEKNKYIAEKILGRCKLDTIQTSYLSEIILLYYSTVIKQGQRNDLKAKTNEKENIKSGLKECAEKFHMSERQISRYIRIPNCCSEIKQMLDNKKISLRAAVELSFLPNEMQIEIINKMKTVHKPHRKITYLQAEYIRLYVEKTQGYFNYDFMKVAFTKKKEILRKEIEKLRNVQVEQVSMYRKNSNVALRKILDDYKNRTNLDDTILLYSILNDWKFQ